MKKQKHSGVPPPIPKRGMLTQYKGLRLSLGFVWLLTMGGCVYTSLQSPNVLPPGQIAVGLEAAAEGTLELSGRPGFGSLGLGINGRVGIMGNTDLGLRLSLLGGFVDVKHQFLRGPIAGAFDVGVSYMTPIDASGGWSANDRASFLGVYPMLLFGSEHYFGGARLVYLLKMPSDKSQSVTRYVLPGVLVGASIGRRFRIVPEANCYYLVDGWADWRIAFGGGLGFQLTF